MGDKVRESIEFLKELQKQMRYEDEHDNDIQASPRFWTIMDYRWDVANEDYDFDKISYFYNDGDYVEFDTVEDLKEFLAEHYLEEIDGFEYDRLEELLQKDYISFDTLWNFVDMCLNDDGYFDSIPVKEESFIVPNTMFITKEDAKNHLKVNSHHYSSKAHTYAMTAWRSPKVNKLWKLLLDFDWGKVQLSENSNEK